MVLLHNAAKSTLETLPSIIECLPQEGHTFVPVSEIIPKGECTLDDIGQQCPAK